MQVVEHSIRPIAMGRYSVARWIMMAGSKVLGRAWTGRPT